MIIKCHICSADPAARWLSPPQNIYVDRHRSDGGSKYRCFAHLSERRREEIEARGKGHRRADRDELEERCRELKEEIEEVSADRDKLEKDRDLHALALGDCELELDRHVSALGGRGLELTAADDLAVVNRDLATGRFSEMLAEVDHD